MNDYRINVSEVEELQMLNDRDGLERLLAKAKSTIVNGALVQLIRKEKDGRMNVFDELDTLDALQKYEAQVLKYIQ